MSAACSTSMPRATTRRSPEHLDYRGPAILRDAVEDVMRAAATPMRIGSMLDLGCGTGLGGAAFRPIVDWLVGVDLSPAMIEQARAKGLYDRLVTADLAAFLAAEAATAAKYHLVLAADVFVYVSDLAPIVAAMARVLAPDGLFAFTVETHSGDGVKLQPTLRYAHGAALHPRGARRCRVDRAAALRNLGPQRKRRAGARACRGGLDRVGFAR